MTGIHLTSTDRQTLLAHYRRSVDAGVRLRAHILLLLADGHTWVNVGAVLFCSLDTISRRKRRFEAEGEHGVDDRGPSFFRGHHQSSKARPRRSRSRKSAVSFSAG